MSPPRLQIPDNLLDELLAALRRHDRTEAERLLAQWADSERDCLDDEDDPDAWWEFLRYLDDPLSAWVHGEATRHVADGRLEHALCLVEIYRRPFTPDDRQAQFTFSQGAVQ